MKHFFLIRLILLTSISIAGNQQKKFFKETDFVFIPSGSFRLQESNGLASIHSFYMFKTEITNLQYHEYLNDLKAQNRMDEYQKALPDTNAWVMNGVYLQPYVDYYFSHPAYNNYPVVNVSFEAAELFCKWLSEKLTMKYPDLKLNDVRIPTSAEWEYAASGGLQAAIYSWAGPYLRNSKGQAMANFLQIGDGRITRTADGFAVVDGYGDEAYYGDYAVTAPVQSYYPNEYGLYNMCGNVAELVHHITYESVDLQYTRKDTAAMGGSWYSPGYDIRISSWVPYEKANPFTGFRPVITHVSRFE